jgi:phytoene synthase
LQAVAAELLPRGVSGAKLAGLESGWAALLDEMPDLDLVADRGVKLFAIAAELLGDSDQRLAAAGRLVAYQQVARMQLLPVPYPAEEVQALTRHRFRRRLRPLTALARLAARDAQLAPALEAEATPGRAVALLSHRLFGIIA